MIDGVKIKRLVAHPDRPDLAQPDIRPGFLVEILRSDDGLLKKFGQSTMSVAFPGTIKAFHWHEKQDDLWFIASGRAVIVLHDMREGSPTRGQTDVIETGAGDYQLILIPVGVAHGYKALAGEPVTLIYHTTESYNAASPDEKRILWDDQSIEFDWSKYD